MSKRILRLHFHYKFVERKVVYGEMNINRVVTMSIRSITGKLQVLRFTIAIFHFCVVLVL